MRIFLVICACAVEAVTPADVIVMGYHMDGVTVGTVSASNPMKCLERCENTLGCRYGVLHLNTRECQLKQTSNATKWDPDHILVARTYKTLSRYPNLEIRSTGSDVRGYGVLVHSEAVCRGLCAVNPTCTTALYVGYAHKTDNSNRGRCWMTAADGSFSRQTVDLHGSVDWNDYVSFVA